MTSEEPGLLTITSPPWATSWQMLFRYFPEQHRAAGTLYCGATSSPRRSATGYDQRSERLRRFLGQPAETRDTGAGPPPRRFHFHRQGAKHAKSNPTLNIER